MGYKGGTTEELIIGDIRYSFGGGSEDLGGFGPTHGQSQGESNQIFFTTSAGKENAELGIITHSNPDTVKPVGNVDLG
jgi:hypothetical protein